MVICILNSDKACIYDLFIRAGADPREGSEFWLLFF